MRNVMLMMFLTASLLSCASKDDTNDKNETVDISIAGADTLTTSVSVASVDGLVSDYLNIKNALVNDDSKGAAEGAGRLETSLAKFNPGSLSGEQSRVYSEVKDDMNDHVKHISTKAGDLAHQREHFEILSKDMYDLVKTVKPSMNLYLIHCPMYNDKKGADWLSESKEIRNPFYGKEMLTCGSVKEEIGM